MSVNDGAETPDLLAERCVACHKDAPRVTAQEIVHLKPLISDWELKDVGGVPRLTRAFRFSSYPESLAFTQRVGELADREDHHPRLVTEWGKVTVSWWTHAIRGLHRNDFIMAAKTDALAREAGALDGSS